MSKFPPPPQSEHTRSISRNNLRGEDAYLRHKKYIREFADVYGSSSTGDASTSRKTDYDVLKESHKFLWDDDKDSSQLSYEEQVAAKYNASLFKEYAVCDLKHYKSGNVALRWRSESEVLSGIGQETCANTRCEHHQPQSESRRLPVLLTLEVPFAYVEHGEPKSALVKVVLCERCKKKLMWKKEKERQDRVQSNDEADPKSGEGKRSSEGRSGNRGLDLDKRPPPSSRSQRHTASDGQAHEGIATSRDSKTRRSRSTSPHRTSRRRSESPHLHPRRNERYPRDHVL